ncbi:type IX secretion/gliding motility protein PorT/SprT [Aquirufa nivalisilvae]|uniref:type IX secretion/gliding motility protein PorT/SprT n=1 Tax=Aquirufa nivalisilvae TaxID=2516557 RepID=UPI0010328D81|nr:porin family protein [Aquirufa nivalisilvae]TBH70860.1 PorT family protein [Aquirufa nivalisilvae]
MKKLLILIVFSLVGFHSLAQGNKYIRINNEFYDDKRVHFGFLFGLSSSNFSMEADPKLAPSISPRNFGFQIGGLANYSFNQFFELKSGINIALYDREITFTQPKPAEPINIARESTWFEIPVLLKYKSIRRMNHRMYVLAGSKFGVEANVKKNSAALSAQTVDFALEYGFGFEGFFKYFKFTPEIRFSHGIANLYSAPSVATNPYFKVSRLNTHNVTLYINFE